jgi:hypothetical protein
LSASIVPYFAAYCSVETMVCKTPVGRGDESSSPLSSPPSSICSPTPTPERELSVSPTSNPLSEIEAINLSPSESFTFKMKTRSRAGPRTPLPDSKVGETKKAGVVKTIKKTIGHLRRPKWDPKVVLTHHRSPLASADIRVCISRKPVHVTNWRVRLYLTRIGDPGPPSGMGVSCARREEGGPSSVPRRRTHSRCRHGDRPC